MTEWDCDAIIVGAGLAGLSCARTLSQAGISIRLLEASDGIGGRVRTDEIEGFRLDRGFQVLLTAYPEAQRQLNYEQLDLHSLEPGALVRHAGKFHRVADPFRRPLRAVGSLLDPTIPFSDKLRIAKLRRASARLSRHGASSAEDMATSAYLTNFGFSEAAIERFFRPFFGGIFLENGLVTSSNWCRYLFHLFAVGNAAIPAQGMQAIPNQMVAGTAPGALSTGHRVLRYELQAGAQGVSVFLENGGQITARHLILATPEQETRRILQLSGYRELLSTMQERRWNMTTTFYFATTHAPIDGPMLMLNGEGPHAGPVNNAIVISSAARTYAPAGAHLVSASVVGAAPQGPTAREELQRDVRTHLQRWFGPGVAAWKTMAAYFIAHAVPLQQSFGTAERGINYSQAGPPPAVTICGDHTQSSSIQGALLSGRLVAEHLVARLNEK